jgi:hypothetical protein
VRGRDYNEVEPGRRALSLADPQDALDVLADPAGVLARLGSQSPLIRYYAETRDGQTHMLSDFISREELHRLDLLARSPAGHSRQRRRQPVLSDREDRIGLAGRPP